MTCPPPEATLEALLAGQAAVLEELRALRRAVDAMSGRREGAGGADAYLVLRIRDHVGETLFNTAELIEHAREPASRALSDAIVAAIGALNGRKLGQFLKRMEGVNCSGVEVLRISADRDGAVWAVRVSSRENSHPRA